MNQPRHNERRELNIFQRHNSQKENGSDGGGDDACNNNNAVENKVHAN